MFLGKLVGVGEELQDYGRLLAEAARMGLHLGLDG
jgi:hypothetical protein